MSTEQKADYDIVRSLNGLMEIELQDALNENDFQDYKIKSKALITKLLAKLEDNFEYQKYLETEVQRLESIQVEMKENNELKVQKIQSHENIIQDKDETISKLRSELEESRASFNTLQTMRNTEMQAVAVVCNSLTNRLKALNINFGDVENQNEDRNSSN